MLRRDTFRAGFITGLLLPAIIFGIIYEANDMWFINRLGDRGLHTSFIGVISVFINIIPFNGYSRHKKGNAMRGILTITIIYAFILLGFFIHDWI
jgi:Co/Zn/Cd efflux system component